MEQPFDDSAKNFYQRFFTDLGMRTTAQHEVFSRSRSIDLLVECAVADLPKLQGTVFTHFRRVNALEFKGIHDPLTAVDFNLIMMRAWGIGVRDLSQQETADDKFSTAAAEPKTKEPDSNTVYLKTQEIAETPRQRTVTIVCVTRPQKVLNTLQHEFAFTVTKEAGIYCNNDDRIPVWIIHPTELELKPANYPLLPLARGKKLEQFIELCVAEGLSDYLQLTLDIGVASDPDAIWHKIMELINMKVTVREETWPVIDEFFRKVPEALQKLPTLQEALEAYARKAVEETERKAAEEARKAAEEARKAAEEARRAAEKEAQKAAYDAELRGEIRGATLGEIKSHRQTLLLVLRHRFGEVPETIATIIESTVDLYRLQQWLEEALDANALGQISFPPHPQK